MTFKYHLNKQPIRFLISGAIIAASEYGSFFILIKLSVDVLIANASSFLLSLLVGFFLNKFWVFKVGGSGKRQLAAYISLAFINLGISSGLMWIIAVLLGTQPFAAKIAIMLIIAASNYLLFSKLIFKTKPVEAL